jgi:hypothetical protein
MDGKAWGGLRLVEGVGRGHMFNWIEVDWLGFLVYEVFLRVFGHCCGEMRRRVEVGGYTGSW